MIHKWSEYNLGSDDGYIEWIYRLVKSESPKRILEIGMGPGGSSTATLLATKDIASEVYTVDIQELGDTRRKVFDITEAGDRWHPILGESPFILDSISGKFDYIYIDGDHRADGAYHDALYCDKKLMPGKLMVFDDCGNNWAEQTNEGIRRWKIDCPWYDELSIDLGVINSNGPRVFRKCLK